MSRSDQLACTSQGEVDVIADVVFANDLLEVVALQHVLDLGIDTREYDGDAFLLAHETHVLEVVQTGRVDEGYLTHADDANLRSIAVAGHDVLEAVTGSKEVGTVDLVDFYMLGDGEVLQVATLHIGIFVEVDLVENGMYIGGLSHTAHEEQTGADESELDGDGEVEDDGEEEG